jgi:NADH-quinone oxidoreductase subunit L
LILGLVVITLAAPFLSFITSFLFIPTRYAWLSPLISTTLMALASTAVVVVLLHIYPDSYTYSQLWFSIADKEIQFGILLNATSLPMLLIVSIVSLLVHIYSIGYMAVDSRLRHYFAMLGFFTFSMLGLSMANNLLLLFCFWELIGFSSYLLIGHWREKQQVASAAKKAFLMNRLGDLGFVIGLMIVWSESGTFDLETLLIMSNPHSNTVASIFILIGVMGKSAQFPLFNWLPDAMEGPTPVSALIHAATLVAAGVYLMIRIHWMFSPSVLVIAAAIGTCTALMGALAAFTQYDIKKILAYSTISQLGIMIAAIGVGSPNSAMLHLFTHAFFKAGLFLGAGSIIHALHHLQNKSQKSFDPQDIRQLGSLRKKLPFTFIAFVITGSALAGLPLTSGFLSKDVILSSAWSWSQIESWRFIIVIVLYSVTFLTAAYIFRLVWFVFISKSQHNFENVSESPWIMRIPILILSACSIWLAISWNPLTLKTWLPSSPHLSVATTIATVVTFLSLILSWAYFKKQSTPRTNPILLHGFYLDIVYKKIWRVCSDHLAPKSLQLDLKWIDGILHVVAFIHVTLAHFITWFDKYIVDAIVNGAANTALAIGSLTRSFQGGKVQLYIFWALFGVIIFILYLWI